MKRAFISTVLLALLILVLTSCRIPLDDRESKKTVIEYVNDNTDLILKSIKSGDYSEIEKSDIIKKIDEREDCIDFFCGGSGFGSATIYGGFFYSPNDDMYAIWCASPRDSLSPRGKGYYWEEPYGDNYYYVEKICDNIFYYYAHF